MKVKCKKNIWGLKKEKKYSVLGVEGSYYRILNEYKEPYLYDTDLFHAHRERIPGFWETKRLHDGKVLAYPKEWLSSCFFDDYFRGVPYVVSKFWNVYKQRYVNSSSLPPPKQSGILTTPVIITDNFITDASITNHYIISSSDGNIASI